MAVGRKVGLTDEEMIAAGGAAADLAQAGELERNVITFAKTLTETTYPDEAARAFLAAYLSYAQLVDLVFAVAYANLTNRISHTFDLDDEVWFERSRAAEVHMRRRVSQKGK